MFPAGVRSPESSVNESGACLLDLRRRTGQYLPTAASTGCVLPHAVKRRGLSGTSRVENLLIYELNGMVSMLIQSSPQGILPRTMSGRSQNLLFGAISTASDPIPRCAAAIQDVVIELGKYWKLKPDHAKSIAPEIDLGDLFSCVYSFPDFRYARAWLMMTDIANTQQICRAAIKYSFCSAATSLRHICLWLSSDPMPCSPQGCCNPYSHVSRKLCRLLHFS